MFCSGCGKQVNENLNFCNHCGARIESKTEDLESAFNFNSAIITGIFGMFGLFGFIFLTIKLLEKNLDPSFVFVVIALYIAAVLGICFLLFRQTASQPLKSRRKENAEEESLPKKLPAETVVQLNASHQMPVGSVTENTTRTLDEIAVERK